jgi:hypothetical protein
LPADDQAGSKRPRNRRQACLAFTWLSAIDCQKGPIIKHLFDCQDRRPGQGSSQKEKEARRDEREAWAVQLRTMKKWIALGVVVIAGLVYVHYYASARLEAMPEKIRSSPAEINAQHQLELKSETPLQ